MFDAEFENRVIQALGCTSHRDNAERNQAEAFLAEASHVAGYATALLKISADKTLVQSRNLPTMVNYAAAIQLGRLVKLHWKTKPSDNESTYG